MGWAVGGCCYLGGPEQCCMVIGVATLRGGRGRRLKGLDEDVMSRDGRREGIAFLWHYLNYTKGCTGVRSLTVNQSIYFYSILLFLIIHSLLVLYLVHVLVLFIMWNRDSGDVTDSGLY